jgi:hypothetical protein
VAEALGKDLAALGGYFGSVGMLLGKNEDPWVQQALCRGLDSVLGAFLKSDSLSHESRLRLAETIARESKNPNVRSAMSLALSGHLNGMAPELAEKQRRLEAMSAHGKLSEAARRNNRAPQLSPPWLGDEAYRQRLAQEVPELQARQLQGQAALGQLLAGRQEHGKREVPESQLGSLYELMRQAYPGGMIGGAREVMRALFVPPSQASVASFEQIAGQTLKSPNRFDPRALGYFIEAGRQALEVEPSLQAKQEQEMLLSLAGPVLQIALAGSLGAFGVSAAEKLGLTARQAGAFGAAVGQAGEEGLNLALDSKKVAEALRALQASHPGSSLANVQDLLHLSRPLRFSKGIQ